MKKILFIFGITLLAGCVAHQSENASVMTNLPTDVLNSQVVVVPPENIITQPDEFREALQKLPDVPRISNDKQESYMGKLSKKLRKELRSTGAQVKEVQGQIDIIVPDKVSFGKNQMTVQNSFQDALSSVAKLLKEYDQTMVQIIGYTDDLGGVLANQKFSLQKANVIADFLKTRGVISERIITDGAGGDNPIANNLIATGREMNRRVEITLISLQ